ILHGLVPTHPHDRMIGHPAQAVPILRRVPAVLHERTVLRHRHRILPDPVRLQLHLVLRELLRTRRGISSLIAPHPELPPPAPPRTPAHPPEAAPTPPRRTSDPRALRAHPPPVPVPRPAARPREPPAPAIARRARPWVAPDRSASRDP